MSSIMVQDSYTMGMEGLAIHTFGLHPQVCKSLNLPFPLYNLYTYGIRDYWGAYDMGVRFLIEILYVQE